MYAQFFGTFLLSHNVITNEQLLDALAKKASSHIKLGTLAIHKGYMNANEVDQVIIQQTHEDMRFGEIAIKDGYLTQEQVDELVQSQSPDFLLLGQVLVQEGYITNSELEQLINEYEAENELYDLNYSDERREDLEHMVSNFLHTSGQALSSYELTYIKLLFNNLIRFIGGDFTPLSPSACTEYPVNYCVFQTIHGPFTLKTYIDMPETTCIEFASRYVGEQFKDFDEYVQASIEDFLNLHNGLYNVNISNTLGIDLTLSPPEINYCDLLTLSGSSYLMQVIYPFGVINFLFEIEAAS